MSTQMIIIILLYYRSDARLYSNITVCDFFGTMNFTAISVESWSDSFKECTDDTSSSPINFVNGGNSAPAKNLKRTVCLKYDMTPDGNCSCRMDCLLEFSADNYIFLTAVGCNETQFNNSLVVYQNHENAVMTRMGYFMCPTSEWSSVINAFVLKSAHIHNDLKIRMWWLTVYSVCDIVYTVTQWYLKLKLWIFSEVIVNMNVLYILWFFMFPLQD